MSVRFDCHQLDWIDPREIYAYMYPLNGVNINELLFIHTPHTCIDLLSKSKVTLDASVSNFIHPWSFIFRVKLILIYTSDMWNSACRSHT